MKKPGETRVLEISQPFQLFPFWPAKGEQCGGHFTQTSLWQEA